MSQKGGLLEISLWALKNWTYSNIYLATFTKSTGEMLSLVEDRKEGKKGV